MGSAFIASLRLVSSRARPSCHALCAWVTKFRLKSTRLLAPLCDLQSAGLHSKTARQSTSSGPACAPSPSHLATTTTTTARRHAHGVQIIERLHGARMRLCMCVYLFPSFFLVFFLSRVSRMCVVPSARVFAEAALYVPYSRRTTARMHGHVRANSRLYIAHMLYIESTPSA